MKMILPLALLVATALPARAESFGSEIDVHGLAVQARANAASYPAPTASAADSTYDSAPSLPPLAPSRLIALIQLAARWREEKAGAKAALDAFVQNRIRKDGHADEWRGIGAHVWGLAESIEAEQDILADRLSARVAGETAAPAQRDARLAAIQTLADFRKLGVYGNLVPRIIDEAITSKTGESVGSRDAGPSWRMALTWTEGQSVNRAIIPLTGVSPDDYDAAGKAVAAEYTAAHPLSPWPARRD